MAITIEHEYRSIDKGDWGDGPWQQEPDKVQWIDEATGLPCLAVRNSDMGHWCGYVGVPEGHPAYGLDYSAADTLVEEGEDGDGGLSVHGGLTFAGPCQEGDEATSICHVPAPGQPDKVWWLGFDCAHSWDIRPGHDALMARLGLPLLRMPPPPTSRLPREVYRTLGYVQDECARLARQLKALVSPVGTLRARVLGRARQDGLQPYLPDMQG